MTRDDSHPTADVGKPGTDRRSFLLPEIHDAAKAAGIDAPSDVLRFAERRIGLIPGSLRRLSHLNGDSQRAVLRSLEALAREQGGNRD